MGAGSGESHSLFISLSLAYNNVMANKSDRTLEIEKMIEPTRTILYTLNSARESETNSDILKYSLYIPVPLFKELDRDADDLGKTINQHILHILQLAYGHVRHETHPRWATVEGMFDRDDDGFAGG